MIGPLGFLVFHFCHVSEFSRPQLRWRCDPIRNDDTFFTALNLDSGYSVSVFVSFLTFYVLQMWMIHEILSVLYIAVFRWSLMNFCHVCDRKYVHIFVVKQMPKAGIFSSFCSPVIPRLTKIIRSVITFVNRNLR